MHNRGFRRGYRCRGQIVALTGLVLPVLLGVMGLALDGGLIYHVKRRIQTAADAGALGGAREIWRQNSSLVTSGAKNDTALNGFTDANATIIVNNPPASGPHTGDTNFVEVIVSQEVPTFFMRIVDRQQTLVRARAVAGIWSAANGCVTVLDPTRQGALTVQGGATLTSGCNVMVNSSSDRGITLNGGGCIYSEDVGVTGGYVANGGAKCIEPAPTTGVPPAMDPLAYLVPPSIPNGLAVVATNLQITGAVSVPPLLPGRYDGGISISGGTVTFTGGTYVLDGGISISGGVVVFGPGTYILNGGGMTITGNSVVSGNGVTFYNTWSPGAPGGWGDFDIAGTATVNFKAPSAGDYEGMLFWNDANAPYRDPGSRINGTSNSTFEGVLYFPSTNLTYAGTSTAAWTMMIADTLTISGNTVVQSDYSASDVNPPTRIASVVE